MIFFTADTHFGHFNTIEYCNRPFNSVEVMNRTIIDNWNAKVDKKDTVYHLGDFGMGSLEYLENIFRHLNGLKILIRGSHDKKEVLNLGWYHPVKDGSVYLLSGRELTHFTIVDSPDVFLSHYPHRSWPKSFHGSWHLFGHTHGRLSSWGKSFDVGVDCNSFTPISVLEVYKKMETLGWEEKDKS
jgi:calcineurin-like phosphoesterase family protein